MSFTTISLAEMKQLLNDGWTEVIGSSSTHEYVFEKLINENPKIVIKVYTSISKHDDNSRSKGDDAIRICAVDLTNRRGWISTTRVLRMENWRTHLTKAISSVTFQSNKRLGKNQPRQQHQQPHQSGSNEKFKFINATHEKKLYHPCWTDCKNNSYATEASTLDANREKYRRDTCPSCGGRYSKIDLTKTLRNDDEIQGWEFKCPHCKASLTVFND